MNSNDVYQKSNLGREEIRNQTLGVLPREARTLLITIDGKKLIKIIWTRLMTMICLLSLVV